MLACAETGKIDGCKDGLVVGDEDSQTERGARKDISIVSGISLVSTSEGSCPITSIGMGLGNGRTSFGSAALTADTQTETPRTRASTKVRTFFANKRMLLILRPNVREKSSEPCPLGHSGFIPE